MSLVLVLLMLFSEDLVCGQFDDVDFAELFPPSHKFQNGEYYGQTVCKETTDNCDTPHGLGSYRRKDGKILYDGEWYNGKYTYYLVYLVKTFLFSVACFKSRKW